MSMYESALRWLDCGVSLVPLQPKSKHFVVGFGGYQKQIVTKADARFWFADRRCNMAVVTGSGVVVLDVDQVRDYEQLIERWPIMAETYTEKTQQGYHIFLSGDGASGIIDGVEIKGCGSVIMSAPSVHPTGFVYVPINELELKPLPTFFSISDPIKTLSEGKQKHGGDQSLDTLTRIKETYDLLTLAETQTHLTKHGQWHHGNCPFASHSGGRFWVNVDAGLWGCRACNIRGDVVNLYAKIHGLTVNMAIKEMAAGL